MRFQMENLDRLTVAEMEEFLESHRKVKMDAAGDGVAYELIERVLRVQQYRRLKKSAKGTVRRFLAKVTGLSRAQVTRLIGRWRQTKRVERQPARRSAFPRRYSTADAALLADVDAAHEDLSGPAVRRILQREFTVYGDPAYERLANISASHIYNLRRSAAYRKVRVCVEHTQARRVSIGERRRPEPKGQPGYLRVDTVHQGTHDGQAGIYHVNAVDTVVQWQVVGCVETIAERHLIPVLEAILHQFPFRIRGFHCDNGSEFINHTVAKLLNKLLVEFTKSRAYKTTDNALVEGKNGAVIRKHIGYGPVPAKHAEEFQKFYTAHLNPYLNFHRPCGFPTLRSNKRGKRKRAYPNQDYRTPYEKLSSLPEWERYLKAGIDAAHLAKQAQRMSDTHAARQMQKAKAALFRRCRVKGVAL
jgi:hypothetical protein